MSNIFYLNNRNEIVDFLEDLPLTSIDSLFKSAYTNVVKNDIIQKFTKGVINYTITGDISVKKLDKVLDIFEYDVLKNMKGRFYIGKYYMLCNISVSTPQGINLHSDMIKVSLTVTTSLANWIKETSFALNKLQTSGTNDANIKKYTYSYPYVYSNNKNTVSIYNDSSFENDAVIRMYGPCSNPYVKIGDVLYQVFINLDKNEHLEINTYSETIEKVSNYGSRTSIFEYRDKKKSNFFEKVPSGMQRVSWGGDFPVEIVLLDIRSAPRWITL